MPINPLIDRFARPLRDMRISVTDRCNFRCIYCMPKAHFGSCHKFVRHARLLTFEEITRVAGIFAGLGVRKLRITGGEPLLRRNIESLISQLAGIAGIDDICMTTNGSLLTRSRARNLKNSGLNRVTVSLDALGDPNFRGINDVNVSVDRVLTGIDNAQAAGLAPVKVNMVTMRGVNEAEILPIVRLFHGTGIVPRFIEYMDAGNCNGWRSDKVVPAEEIIDLIQREYRLEPLAPLHSGEVATRWRHVDGGGEIGVIASVSQPFCGGCNRIRMSAEGKLHTCLFSERGYDLRALLRADESDADLLYFITEIWRQRSERYSEIRSRAARSTEKVEMSYIGG